jgi:hypothetical protein
MSFEGAMTTAFVQFTDSTSTKVLSVFACAQDADAYPNQGEIDSSDVRYLTFLNPPATPAQQAASALADGLEITSTSAPTLDGTYACSSDMITYMNSELNAILLNGAFADGSTVLEWQDVSLALHAFTVAQFKDFAVALGAYVSGVRKYAIGAAGATLPSATATIA